MIHIKKDREYEILSSRTRKRRYGFEIFRMLKGYGTKDKARGGEIMGQSRTRNEVRAPGHRTMEKDVLPLHYSCSRLSESPNTMTSKSDGFMSED